MGIKEAIKRKAHEAGFDLVGIAPLETGGDLDFARRWVDEGRAGEMHYLRNPKRHDPRRVLPSVQSIVCVGLVYNSPQPYSAAVHAFPKTRASAADRSTRRHPLTNNPEQGIPGQLPEHTGWISRYAWGRDYHKVTKAKLEALRKAIEGLAPGTETRVYVDTGPVVERAFARLSGIGWMGRNTCLINQQKGSWFFLGVILTSLALEPDMPAPDRCGSCRRCIEACPTGALDKPYNMDASRCIAYLTVELKGPVPAELRPAMGVNIFGCDICQDVCPWNSPRHLPEAMRRPAQDQSSLATSGTGRRGAAVTRVAEFLPQRVKVGCGKPSRPSELSLFNPSLAALASMTEEEFRIVFRDSPVKRAKFQGFIRNLCIAIGNSRNRSLIATIRSWRSHEDAVIQGHAAWALEQLEKSSAQRASGL
jgi:epoxyqueuosine reductase